MSGCRSAGDEPNNLESVTFPDFPILSKFLVTSVISQSPKLSSEYRKSGQKPVSGYFASFGIRLANIYFQKRARLSFFKERREIRIYSTQTRILLAYIASSMIEVRVYHRF
jgi:hypothetical protein